MGSFLSSLEKDKPLYALNVGEFEQLMAELMQANQIQSPERIPVFTEVVSDQMNISECAKYLNVSESTLHRYKNNRAIPFYKVGRTVYFKRSEVDAAINSEQKKKGASK